MVMMVWFSGRFLVMRVCCVFDPVVYRMISLVSVLIVFVVIIILLIFLRSLLILRMRRSLIFWICSFLCVEMRVSMICLRIMCCQVGARVVGWYRYSCVDVGSHGC